MRRFDPWLGLGPALHDANEKWDVWLYPDYIAACAKALASDYAKDQSINFEQRMEIHLDTLGSGPDLTKAQSHAAKHVIGIIFAENKAARIEEADT